MLRILLTIARWTIYYHIISWGFRHFDGAKLLRPYIHHDAWRHPVEYAEMYGYDAEQHFVTTSDNVVLEVHRLNSKTNAGRSKIPVILQHGLTGNSFGWIANLPDQSLGFILADAGYDVWLTNTRGNDFGRKSENQTDFWKFTKDQLALIDLPETIDYILEKTGKPYLHCVGHSQGGFMLMALLSEKPEYNKKIRLGVGLAPVLKLSDTNLFIKIHYGYLDAFTFLSPQQMHTNDRFPINLIMNPVFCGILPRACAWILRVNAGGHESQTDISRMPVYAGSLPAGSSFQNFLHYTQTMRADRFGKFDYGEEKNLQLYGQREPPIYDLKKISGKVAVFYCEGENDIFAGSRHNKWLIESIPKKSLVHSEALKNFEHLDFGLGINAKASLYDKIIELMKTNED